MGDESPTLFPLAPSAPTPAPYAEPAGGRGHGESPSAHRDAASGRRSARLVGGAGRCAGRVGRLPRVGDDGGAAPAARRRRAGGRRDRPQRIARTGDIATILKADVPAVVAIVDDGGPDSGGAAGTGFVISSDGVIVTNNHVVADAKKIQAVFSDGTSRSATVARAATRPAISRW